MSNSQLKQAYGKKKGKKEERKFGSCLAVVRK